MPDRICSSCGNVWAPTFKFCPLDGAVIDSIGPAATAPAVVAAPAVAPAVVAPAARTGGRSIRTVATIASTDEQPPAASETWTFGCRPSRRTGTPRAPEVRAGDTQRHARVEVSSAPVPNDRGPEQAGARSGSTAITSRPIPPLFTSRTAALDSRATPPVDSRPSAPPIAPRAPAIPLESRPLPFAPRTSLSESRHAPIEARPAPVEVRSTPVAARVPPPLPEPGPTPARPLRPEATVVVSDWYSSPEQIAPHQGDNDPLDLSFVTTDRTPKPVSPRPFFEPIAGPSTRPARPRANASADADEARHTLTKAPAREPTPTVNRARKPNPIEVVDTRTNDRPDLEFHNRPTLLREPRVAPTKRRHIEHDPGQDDEQTVFVEQKQRSSAAFSDTAWFKRPVPPGAVDPDTGFVSFDDSSYVRDFGTTNTQRRRYSLRKSDEVVD